jgi:hypothetical protein
LVVQNKPLHHNPRVVGLSQKYSLALNETPKRPGTRYQFDSAKTLQFLCAHHRFLIALIFIFYNRKGPTEEQPEQVAAITNEERTLLGDGEQTMSVLQQ